MSGYRFDRLKVLVVDDNPHMREIVSALLHAYGIPRVHEAGSGEEAWEFLQLKPCDMILLDWVMDGMSGLELTKRIRTSPDSPNPFVPIVMLTGYTSTERVWMARDGASTKSSPNRFRQRRSLPMFFR